MSSPSSSGTSAVGAVHAVGALQPVLREHWPGLLPGALLRLRQDGEGGHGGHGGGNTSAGAGPAPWLLDPLDGGQVLVLAAPPLDDLTAGEQLLLRVRALQPRLELEVLERRRDPQDTRAGQARWAPDSGWTQLSLLRPEGALLRHRVQILARPISVPPSALMNAPLLVQAWTEALAQGRPPMTPGGEPFWLLPLPYWMNARRSPGGQFGHQGQQGQQGHQGPHPAGAEEDEPALSLMLRWRGQAVALQISGTREAGLSLVLLAEREATLADLRATLPRLATALVRAGWRLQRLHWRQQALWVPEDGGPVLRADAALLGVAAELLLALE